MAEKIRWERPELGQWCDIRAIALKGGEPYVNTEWFTKPLEKEIQGMYIGWRTVANGSMESDYEYESWEHPAHEVGKFFVRSESLEVWLFVVSDRKNPIRAFPQSVMIGIE